MQRWLYGQMLLMLILGSSSALVFGLLGVRYFYAFAVFAGVANFVPILGPIATVVVAGVVAGLDSWMKVVGVIIFYLVYQQVENAYLTPRIMRSAVDLPGVAVIVALTIGGELAGLLGAIVAVPTAALVATVVNDYLVRRPGPSRVQSRCRVTRGPALRTGASKLAEQFFAARPWSVSGICIQVTSVTGIFQLRTPTIGEVLCALEADEAVVSAGNHDRAEGKLR